LPLDGGLLARDELHGNSLIRDVRFPRLSISAEHGLPAADRTELFLDGLFLR
jgi:hypothetical protein